MSSCTFENFNGLGYDTSSADDAVDSNSAYISTPSLIAFSNSYIAQYTLSGLSFTSITLKGETKQNVYSKHPYLFGPSTGE